MANWITLSRIALIAPFVLAFLTNAPWNMNAALVIFAVAALSDFADGWVARARGEVSAIGAALDPIADKLLIAAALVLLTRNGAIHGGHVIAALIVILREIGIAGLREAIAAKGGQLPVDRAAKWKTTLQLLAAGLLIAATPNGILGLGAQSPALAVLWAAALLTLFTGARYARRAAATLSAS